MDLEKLRSIRQGGRMKGKVRLRELKEDGKTRGYEYDYPDGRQGAVVRPEPVRLRISLRGDR